MIRVKGTLDPFRAATVPGQFDEEQYYRFQGYQERIEVDEWEIVDASVIWWRQVLWEWKQEVKKIYEEVLPEEEAGVLSAMLLGDKSELSQETRDLYQKNGISHLLAVSGLHVSLLGGAFLIFLKKFHIRSIPANCISVFFVLSYGCMIDYPVATSRAVIMMLLSLSADIVGRTYDMPTALSLALLWILLVNPEAVFQAGTQMSFGAVWGILLFVPMFKLKLSGIRKGLWESVSVSISVLCVTLPVQMYHFCEVSVVGILSNLLVLPLMPVLLLSGMLGGVTGMLGGKICPLLMQFSLGGGYSVIVINLHIIHILSVITLNPP